MERKIPNHIAVIMDGNGRWAKSKMLPRTMGHREGAKTLDKILNYSAKIGVKYLTVYAFSTENWKRPEKEVKALMKLFSEYMKKERKKIMDNDIRFMVSGRREGVDLKLVEEIEELEEATKENKGITLNIAFNYGGRSEIIDAVKRIIESGDSDIDEEKFASYLYNNIPDPELLIRTSGELRISNFLLWQIAYSEIYITDLYWPQFNEKELDKAIASYNKRDRKFGGLIDEK